eukprot:Clim_evm55s88 gene=Clim_evmTU55s88
MGPELKQVASLSGHYERVWCVQWNPSGTILASTSSDKSVRLWVNTPDKGWTHGDALEQGHTRTVRFASWSPDGRRIASGSFDSMICVWEAQGEGMIADFECVAQLEGHENEIKCTAWSPNGQLLASCSRDKSVWIWEADEDAEFECVGVLTYHTQDVKFIKWHPEEEILGSASYDDTVRLHREDDDDFECYVTLTGHESTVWAFDWNKDGTQIATVSDDKTLRIWKCTDKRNYDEWRCVAILSGFFTRAIYSVSWHHELNLIAAAGADDSIQIFAYEEGSTKITEDGGGWYRLANQAHAHDMDVNGVCWNQHVSETGEALLASAGDDALVKIWSFKNP